MWSRFLNQRSDRGGLGETYQTHNFDHVDIKMRAAAVLGLGFQGGVERELKR